MRVIYRAEHLVDAHLAKGLLEQAGILAFVLGEYLSGGIGGLPAMGLMAVAVADGDIDAANEVLQQWRAATPIPCDDVDALPQPG